MLIIRSLIYSQIYLISFVCRCKVVQCRFNSVRMQISCRFTINLMSLWSCFAIVLIQFSEWFKIIVWSFSCGFQVVWGRLQIASISQVAKPLCVRFHIPLISLQCHCDVVSISFCCYLDLVLMLFWGLFNFVLLLVLLCWCRLDNGLMLLYNRYNAALMSFQCRFNVGSRSIFMPFPCRLIAVVKLFTRPYSAVSASQSGRFDVVAWML